MLKKGMCVEINMSQPFRLLAEARSHLPFQGRYNSMYSSNYRCCCELLYAP